MSLRYWTPNLYWTGSKLFRGRLA